MLRPVSLELSPIHDENSCDDYDTMMAAKFTSDNCDNFIVTMFGASVDGTMANVTRFSSIPVRSPTQIRLCERTDHLRGSLVL